MEIRHVTPPKLGDPHLGQRLLCYRPTRNNTPRLEIEKTSQKLIFHNYGHANCGWSLAPGSSRYCVAMIEKEIGTRNKKTPIAVLGGGVIGLSSAMELVKRGYTNVTVIAESFYDLTSHKAGGLFSPEPVNYEAEMKEIMETMYVESQYFYQQIASGKNSTINLGCRNMPAYFTSREESGLEPCVGKGMNPAKDVALDFGNGKPRKMVAYDDSIFMDVGQLMVLMRSYLEKLQVPFEKRKVMHHDEIRQAIIVNCTGLGARELNQDLQVKPAQGHIVLLKDQNPRHLDYMIFIDFKEPLRSQSGFEMFHFFCMIPKVLPGSPPTDVGMISGTFIENADSSFPHDEEFDRVIERAREFYHIK